MVRRKRKVRLTKRDYAILRDAEKYGLVVPEFLHAQRFADKQPAAVKSTLRRLYGRPPRYLYLRPESLDAHRVYYRLTSRGCRLLGVSRDASRALGRKAIVDRYAALWFICAEHSGQRTLFDPRQFPEQFSHIRKRLPRKRFYIEQSSDGTMQLGYFVVDFRTDIRRLVRQCCQVMRSFIEHGWFNDYLVSGRFGFTVLTFNEGKAKEIERLLRIAFRKQLSRPLQTLGVRNRLLPIQVLVVPGMDSLIPQET
jgi:hypothetical protein